MFKLNVSLSQVNCKAVPQLRHITTLNSNNPYL